MSMHVTDIIQMFEEWAPKWAAWEKDNVGLQVGSAQRKVKNVLITLDVTRQTIEEAIEKKIDLIISHHPLLFRSPSAITSTDSIGELILQLAEHRIALFSAHTNLDYTKGGVSFTLAETLGLKGVRFLSPLKNSLAKIAVFVPEGYTDIVIHTMKNAGAGIIGEYSYCSFGSKGRGSFSGSSSTDPFVGKRNTLEFVEETKLEMIAPRAKISNVIAAMKTAHPYEEVAYDVYNVENPNLNFGMGALGTLPKPQTLGSFLKSTKRKLGAKILRFTGNTAKKIQTVAVCGGAGSHLLPEAIASNADVFITADVRYHTFHTTVGNISLVDAGHWETEHMILKPIADRLRNTAQAANQPITIFLTKHKTNPIQTI